jgi:VWFA-related protein
MIDVGLTTRLSFAQTAAQSLIDALSPADAATVGTMGAEVSVRRTVTSDHLALRRTVREEVWPQPASPSPWPGLNAAISALAPHAGRRVVVFLSSGAEGGPAASRNQVRARALAHGVTVYPVFFRGSLLNRLWDGGCPSAGRCQNQSEVLVLNIEAPGTYLEPLSAATGGRLLTVEDDEDLSASMRAFVEELRHQYLLGVPAGSRDGKTHTIRVQTVRTGLRVAARESYTAAAR